MSNHRLEFLYGPLPKLSLYQRFVLAVNGYVFLRWMTPEGYGDAVPVYAVKCRRHGVFVDTPHGFSGYFTCDGCLAEGDVLIRWRVHA